MSPPSASSRVGTSKAERAYTGAGLWCYTQLIALDDAVASPPNGAALMVGGFMKVGTPEPLMDELVRQRQRELAVNDTASPGIGIGIGKLVTLRRFGYWS